ncbi:hypothetical protein J1N35_019204 [Gossypium stocksii]|uniref:Uncharacterized protein n=1 Tax=Gossypium stocksii TaxID=47602 RepID=A0A9D3VRR0_9ROSI|nr:hypothetical protein J1N35_019204 [Gossypium stocksii]
MVLALKEQIEELKGELNICKAALGNGVLVVAPMPKIDVLKPKEFEMRSTKDADTSCQQMKDEVISLNGFGKSSIENSSHNFTRAYRG